MFNVETTTTRDGLRHNFDQIGVRYDINFCPGSGRQGMCYMIIYFLLVAFTSSYLRLLFTFITFNVYREKANRPLPNLPRRKATPLNHERRELVFAMYVVEKS